MLRMSPVSILSSDRNPQDGRRARASTEAVDETCVCNEKEADRRGKVSKLAESCMCLC